MAGDEMTSLLYIVVFGGWLCLMCLVLRCCTQPNDGMSMLELETELELAAFSALHNKPLVCVDGQPARFARVEALRSPNDPENPTRSGETTPTTGPDMTNTHGGPLPALDTSCAAADGLPSAVAVWSPILALCNFVEPLTSRASALWNSGRLSVTFHEQEPSAGVGDSSSRGGDEGLTLAAPTAPAAGSREGEDVAAPGAIALTVLSVQDDSSGVSGWRTRDTRWGAETSIAADTASVGVAPIATGKGWLVKVRPQEGTVETWDCARASEADHRCRAHGDSDGNCGGNVGDDGCDDCSGGIVVPQVGAGLESKLEEKEEEREEEEKKEIVTLDFERPDAGGTEISPV